MSVWGQPWSLNPANSFIWGSVRNLPSGLRLEGRDAHGAGPRRSRGIFDSEIPSRAVTVHTSLHLPRDSAALAFYVRIFF